STEPVVLVGTLQGSFLASFLLGWGVTIGPGLASDPLDTIRRRMMMTSGSGVDYKSMFDADANILRGRTISAPSIHDRTQNMFAGVAGAGVLSVYDLFQEAVFGKVYCGGAVIR
ncbi:hypothetical protein C8R42DRAFT_576159, partial [Lentinula raphanica]